MCTCSTQHRPLARSIRVPQPRQHTQSISSSSHFLARNFHHQRLAPHLCHPQLRTGTLWVQSLHFLKLDRQTHRLCMHTTESLYSCNHATESLYSSMHSTRSPDQILPCRCTHKLRPRQAHECALNAPAQPTNPSTKPTACTTAPTLYPVVMASVPLACFIQFVSRASKVALGGIENAGQRTCASAGECQRLSLRTILHPTDQISDK